MWCGAVCGVTRADYIHNLGLKFGLYTCIGTETCKWHRPGSFGHYEQDAATLAGWGLDFIKSDNCNTPGGYTEQQLYTNFSTALNATGTCAAVGVADAAQGGRFCSRCASGASPTC